MTTRSQLTRQRESAIATYQQVAGRPSPPASLWKRQLAAAKTAWARLSVAELLHSGGSEQALVELIEERYAISRTEADRQVQRFILRQAG